MVHGRHALEFLEHSIDLEHVAHVLCTLCLEAIRAEAACMIENKISAVMCLLFGPLTLVDIFLGLLFHPSLSHQLYLIVYLIWSVPHHVSCVSLARLLLVSCHVLVVSLARL